MASPTPALDRRIQQYLRDAAANGRDVERVGPFVATFDPRDAMPYLNYAIPADGATPSAEDVAALIAAYRARERLPRLEYLPTVAPAVEAALLHGGFVVEARLPGMVCTPSDAIALQPDGPIALAVPQGDADFLGMAIAQHTAFGAEPPPADEAAEVGASGRERLAAGGLALLARDTSTGAIVGGGVATAPADGVTEVAGIGVLESHRRRGIAGALTSGLTRAAFAAGVELVWLTPGSDGAHRVYERAGFADATTILHVSTPTM